ncbi:hypothetical protein [Dongia sp.]|uniref:hypothetical protein n=1 Tax=Dongia sp. TaxID=1977262 RepID=UPI0035B2C0B8
MKIFIHADNDDALNAALRTVQTGRGQNDVSASLLITEIAADAEKHLSESGLSTSSMVGAKREYADGGADSKAYKWSIATTWVRIQRGEHGWYLTAVERISQRPKARVIDIYTLSDRQRALIAKETARAAKAKAKADRKIAREAKRAAKAAKIAIRTSAPAMSHETQMAA